MNNGIKEKSQDGVTVESQPVQSQHRVHVKQKKKIFIRRAHSCHMLSVGSWRYHLLLLCMSVLSVRHWPQVQTYTALKFK